VNEAGMPFADGVHLREIVVIPGIDRLLGSPAFRLIACRSPMAPI
jgi:hypothetical protein